MAGFYNKAVVWLGLNEEYPDGDAIDGGEILSGDALRDDATVPDPLGADEVGSPGPQARTSTVRSVGQGEDDADPLAPKPLGSERESPTVRPVPMDEREDATSHLSNGGSGTVRAVPLAKNLAPQTVVPQSYNDAQAVADVFKDGKPVVVDLANAERDLSRRLIDFSAGLCYGLGGRMEKLSSDVYLLSPDGVEVSSEEKERLS